MKNSDIMVSICCITYNHEKYIKKALDSFLMQETDFKYEILINDDASDDNTGNIIREYEKKYPDRIFPIYHKENQYKKGITNPSGEYNFPRVRGKYIAMCEGDDYWIDSYKLKKQFEILEKNKEYSLCIHSARTETMDGSFTDKIIRPYDKATEISPEEIINKKRAYPTASLFFRSEAIKNLPEFYKKCPIGDIPLQLILADYGKAYYIDFPMSVYRIGDVNSWSCREKAGDYKKKQEEYFFQMQSMYNEFDIYTNKKFHSYVELAISRLRFLTYVNLREYEKIFDKKNKAYYKELSVRDRFFIKFEYFFPELYKITRRLVVGK